MNLPTAAAVPVLAPLSIREFSELAKISESSARKLIREGTIRSVRLGKLLRIPHSEVVRVLGVN